MKMRTFRMGLIQTEDQLKFSYLSIIQVFGWEGRGAAGVLSVLDYRRWQGRVTKFFFYLIYFEIRYLTAIIFDVTRITIQANNINTSPV